MDCGCGRSPTGKCIGWHKLSEEEYLEAKKNYQEKEKAEDQLIRKPLASLGLMVGEYFQMTKSLY